MTQNGGIWRGNVGFLKNMLNGWTDILVTGWPAAAITHAPIFNAKYLIAQLTERWHKRACVFNIVIVNQHPPWINTRLPWLGSDGLHTSINWLSWSPYSIRVCFSVRKFSNCRIRDRHTTFSFAATDSESIQAVNKRTGYRGMLSCMAFAFISNCVAKPYNFAVKTATTDAQTHEYWNADPDQRSLGKHSDQMPVR